MLIKEMLPDITFLLCAMGHCKSGEFRALAAKALNFLFIVVFEWLQFEKKKLVIGDCSLKQYRIKFVCAVFLIKHIVKKKEWVIRGKGH